MEQKEESKNLATWQEPELTEIVDTNKTEGGHDSPPENATTGGLWS